VRILIDELIAAIGEENAVLEGQMGLLLAVRGGEMRWVAAAVRIAVLAAVCMVLLAAAACARPAINSHPATREELLADQADQVQYAFGTVLPASHDDCGRPNNDWRCRLPDGKGGSLWAMTTTT